MNDKTVRKIQLADIQNWISDNNKISAYHIADDFIVAHFEDIKADGTPRRLSSNCFMLCLEGEMEVEVNFCPYTLRANDMIFVITTYVLEIKEISNDFKGEFLFLNSQFLGTYQLLSHILAIRNSLIKRPILHLSEQELSRIKRLFACILDISEEQTGPFRSRISEHLSIAIIYEILAFYKNRDTDPETIKLSRNEEVLKQFASLLSEHIQRERSVGFYADKLNLSSKYFSSLIKDVTGKTAAEIISGITIMNAKILLSKSNKNVQQVADELNFPDQSTFGKFFKRETGISPSQFIRKE